MKRQCGGCTLCCKLLPVFDGVTVNGIPTSTTLDKKAGERCIHQSSTKGCRVHGTRQMPYCCKVWHCRWLVEDDTADQRRPDRSHLAIDVMPDYVTIQNNETGERQAVEVVQVWCDPSYPDAHRDPTFRRYVERRAAEGKLTIVRFNSSDVITLVAPSMAPDGNWHEVRGEKEDRQTDFMNTVAALGGKAVMVFSDDNGNTFRRTVDMHTKDKLADAMRAIGLTEMADKAATGYYHDYLSPLDAPELQLIADLAKIGTPDAMALRARVINGEFDASKEESDEWAASPEGQDAFRRLMEQRR